MEAFQFTAKRVEAVERPKKGRAYYRDSAERGLGLMVTESGHKSFYWMRKVGARPERKTLGAFPELTVESARDAANGWNRKLVDWKANGFPADKNPFLKPLPVTFGEIANLYIERHLKANTKNPARASADAEGKLKNHLKGWLAKRADAIRKTDVLELHEKVKKTGAPYLANSYVQFVRIVYNWATASELYYGKNPAKVKLKELFKEQKRRRFLLAHEIAALLTALKDPQTSRDLRDFVTISLMCGARKGDVLSMAWPDVQLDRATWLVPSPKNEEPYLVALVDVVVDILKKRRARAESGATWVFPTTGRVKTKHGHRGDMKKEWYELVARAGITDLRQHDLRRTLGSWQAAGNASLQIIGKSLGHKSTGATQVYAQLQLEPVRASVEAATQAMFAAAKAVPRKLKAAPAPKMLKAAPGRKLARRA